MGRLALELTKRMMSGKVGLFLLSGQKELKRTGFDNFSGLVSSLQKKYPLVMNKSETPIWTQGLISITDSEIAKMMTAIFYVGDDLAQCRQMFNDLRGQDW